MRQDCIGRLAWTRVGGDQVAMSNLLPSSPGASQRPGGGAAVPSRAHRGGSGSPHRSLSHRWFRLAEGHRRLSQLGGRGGCRVGAGEVGAPDPDHGGVDGQGEQRDGGGDQERAAEPGGEGVAVDRCGQRPARAGRVPGPRGDGGLGVDAVGDDGPGDGAERCARPMEPPSCWPVLSRLEATPESASGTRFSATRDSVTNSRAAPAPMTMVGQDPRWCRCRAR